MAVISETMFLKLCRFLLPSLLFLVFVHYAKSATLSLESFDNENKSSTMGEEEEHSQVNKELESPETISLSFAENATFPDLKMEELEKQQGNQSCLYRRCQAHYYNVNNVNRCCRGYRCTLPVPLVVGICLPDIPAFGDIPLIPAHSLQIQTPPIKDEKSNSLSVDRATLGKLVNETRQDNI